MSHNHAYIEALSWYIDQGVDIALDDAPANYYDRVEQKLAESRNKLAQARTNPQNQAQAQTTMGGAGIQGAPSSTTNSGQGAAMTSSPSQSVPASMAEAAAMAGTAELKKQAAAAALACNTLEDLKEAIQNFDGISLKKTAMNMVFADGNPEADIMLVGEAPGADEDRAGQPFMGDEGELLDLMLAAIGLSRKNDDMAQSVYLSNVLNWRPPGNRTPNASEIELSLPFIERHIQLAKPKLLVFSGGVAAQSLLSRSEGISRLRKIWHEYEPVCPELQAASSSPIPAIATFHPSYLLRTPAQKRAAWADLLMIKHKMTF